MADLVVGHYRFTERKGTALGNNINGGARMPLNKLEKELLEEVKQLREKNRTLEAQLEVSQDSLKDYINETKRLSGLLDGSKK